MLLVTGCALLAVSLTNLGHVMRAATADGVAGVFTARQLACVRHPGHETCEWVGSFRSADGMVVREPVKMYGRGREALTVGQEARAVDIGAAGRVYSPGGSHEWIFTGVLLVGGYGIVVLLARRHLMPPPRTGARGGRAAAGRGPAAGRAVADRAVAAGRGGGAGGPSGGPS
ncbi:hypothetical protein ACIBG6_36350 [Streptomyces sp. NPDC050842]|uniref:hypothetical protein n=1 Tax=Streptomyces sp. NPDC050842 TaxID=3365636 RepID=UPI003789920F